MDAVREWLKGHGYDVTDEYDSGDSHAFVFRRRSGEKHTVDVKWDSTRMYSPDQIKTYLDANVLEQIDDDPTTRSIM